jgi:hypothetical protein
MSIDALPNNVDALRALVSQLTSERDVALAQSHRLTEENDKLRHLLKQRKPPVMLFDYPQLQMLPEVGLFRQNLNRWNRL